jgi:hypothetical protein
MTRFDLPVTMASALGLFTARRPMPPDEAAQKEMLAPGTRRTPSGTDHREDRTTTATERQYSREQTGPRRPLTPHGTLELYRQVPPARLRGDYELRPCTRPLPAVRRPLKELQRQEKIGGRTTSGKNPPARRAHQPSQTDDSRSLTGAL